MSFLDDLYALIPSSSCVNCTTNIACCQAEDMGCSRIERDRIRRYVNEHHLKPESGHCPWLIDSKCAIYPVRPFVCRMFGHVPQMYCKDVIAIQLTDEQKAFLDNAYKMHLLQYGSRSVRCSSK